MAINVRPFKPRSSSGGLGEWLFGGDSIWGKLTGGRRNEPRAGADNGAFQLPERPDDGLPDWRINSRDEDMFVPAADSLEIMGTPTKLESNPNYGKPDFWMPGQDSGDAMADMYARFPWIFTGEAPPPDQWSFDDTGKAILAGPADALEAAELFPMLGKAEDIMGYTPPPTGPAPTTLWDTMSFSGDQPHWLDFLGGGVNEAGEPLWKAGATEPVLGALGEIAPALEGIFGPAGTAIFLADALGGDFDMFSPTGLQDSTTALLGELGLSDASPEDQGTALAHWLRGRATPFTMGYQTQSQGLGPAGDGAVPVDDGWVDGSPSGWYDEQMLTGGGVSDEALSPWSANDIVERAFGDSRYWA